MSGGTDTVRALEDRIRAATHAAASEVTADSIGPLRLQPRRRKLRRSNSRRAEADGRPARRGSRRTSGGWRRDGAWRRCLVPLAAAASVMAVLAGVVTLTARPPGNADAGHNAHSSPQLRPSAPAAVGRHGSTAAAAPRHLTVPVRRAQLVTGKLAALPAAVSAAIPAYYVALAGTRKPFASHPYNAAVYSSRTGAELARVAPPAAFRSFIQVSAAADDRTFALAAQFRPARTTAMATIGTPSPAAPDPVASVQASPAAGRAGVAFFILRFNPAGSGTQLTRVPRLSVPAGASFDALSLSPDGSQLAVAYEPGGAATGRASEIQVGSVVTGRVRTWFSPAGSVAGGTSYPQVLSWTSDSRTLAFNWSASGISGRLAAGQAATGLRLLKSSAAPGDVVTRSRLALHWDAATGAIASGGYLSSVALITPDGRGIIAAMDSPAVWQSVPQVGGVPVSFGEFAIGNGALRYVLQYPAGQAVGGPADVLWSDADGRTLIVYAPIGHTSRIAVLRGSLLVPLPQPGTAQFPAAAW